MLFPYNKNMKIDKINLNELWKNILSVVASKIDEVQIETFNDITDGSKIVKIDEVEGKS